MLLVQLAVVLGLLALLGVGARLAWQAWAGPGRTLPGSEVGVLPPGRRAEVAAAIAAARWSPAHDEVDGTTRVLVRRSCTGLDGRPEVLDERVVTTFAASDPEWEVRFIEGMAQARFRCSLLNAEEQL